VRDISRNLLPTGASIEAAMQRLNEGVDGVLFCVDQDGVMRGMLTDGDIRRALLKGAAMSDPVERHMNRSFAKGQSDFSRERLLSLLGPVVRHLPVLDAGGRPVDMVSWSEIWRLPVTTPSLGGNEMKYVADCIETVWISSQGSYIARFQDAFTAFHGAGKALCTSSGTTALHLALLAVGVGPGDEVIVPVVSFGASANVVIHAGARPVFVDIDPETWTMSAAALEGAITPRTKAIMPVHLYGHPCDMDPIMAIARKHGLKVVEDCAESLGAEYKGQKVGLFGDVGCFSFFANKVITTGEGGMVLSREPGLIDRMAILRDHGMSKERRYWHLEPGFNYRMTNVQAAIGLAQMEQIQRFLTHREELVALYNSQLRTIAGIRTPPHAPWARNIYWLYSIEVDPAEFGLTAEELATRLADRGVETRPVFPPLHLQPAYGQKGGSYPAAERFSQRGLSLPTGNSLCLEDARRACNAIAEIAKAART
jgi:perosamine synthetase